MSVDIAFAYCFLDDEYQKTSACRGFLIIDDKADNVTQWK
jgi:hypothetical protein